MHILQTKEEKRKQTLLPVRKAYHFIEFPKQQMVIHRMLNYNVLSL